MRIAAAVLILIVSYFITNKNYNIYEINATLFKYGQPVLGD